MIERKSFLLGYGVKDTDETHFKKTFIYGSELYITFFPLLFQVEVELKFVFDGGKEVQGCWYFKYINLNQLVEWFIYLTNNYQNTIIFKGFTRYWAFSNGQNIFKNNLFS